mgnify:CR=1 FL=1
MNVIYVIIYMKIKEIDKPIQELKKYLDNVLFLEEDNKEKEIFKNLIQDEEIFFF